MKHWEVDVEVRVRKTLIFGGPESAEEAQELVQKTLIEATAVFPLSAFQKVYRVDGYGMAQPVEEVIDDGAQIVAVREVEES